VTGMVMLVSRRPVLPSITSTDGSLRAETYTLPVVWSTARSTGSRPRLKGRPKVGRSWSVVQMTPEPSATYTRPLPTLTSRPAGRPPICVLVAVDGVGTGVGIGVAVGCGVAVGATGAVAEESVAEASRAAVGRGRARGDARGRRCASQAAAQRRSGGGHAGGRGSRPGRRTSAAGRGGGGRVGHVRADLGHQARGIGV